ncbi:MAG: acyl-CoA dehydrogenase family protein [Burkholderiales bacterium]|nr:acyl-CoA dehydrogenase family protein [Burkholderiales bacterium]
MDFDLTEDQTLIKDGLDRLLRERYGFEARRGFMASAGGYSKDLWAAYAEMGILGLPFAAEDGGFDGGFEGVMIVSESLGRVLALEPWLATVVLGGGFLRHAASPAQRAALLPGVIGGSTLLAFAHTEAQSRYDVADCETSAMPLGRGWVLEGEKRVVIHGESADHLFVTARTAGDRRDPEGIGLFLVPASAAGVTRRGYATTDGLRAADIRFEHVEVAGDALLGSPGDGLHLAERVIDEAIAALAAEAVGCMHAALEITLEYLKTRKQFGRAIGSFQALQHRTAEMMVAIEGARSMAMLAAMVAALPDEAARRRQMRAVKIEIGRAARFVGQQAIQLHGGIGMTMEYAVGHYFKRLTAIDTLFGDMDHHLALLAAEGGLLEAA